MLGEIRGEVRFKEPLSFHTSLRIGGAADIFVVPQDIDDIRHALLFAEREQLPVAVVGGATTSSSGTAASAASSSSSRAAWDGRNITVRRRWPVPVSASRPSSARPPR
jgi:hypothetical protein